MPATELNRRQEAVRTFLEQPDRMPRVVRERIEASWRGQPVQLYALADLDGSMRLCRRWLALGPRAIAWVSEDGGEIRGVETARVRAIRRAPALSCTTVTLLGEPGEPALAVFRFTHRQRRAMENVLFVLEQRIAGHETPGTDADAAYAEALAQPVEEAQSSTPVRRLAVVWRLLGYVKPYTRRVALGMTAAALMTLVSLAPPYLTGRLLDGVVKPYQAGELTAEAARNAAWILIGGIAAIYVLESLFLWLRLRLMAMLGENVARDLRTQLYEHLQTLSMNYFSAKRTGSLITRVSSDTDRLWEFIAFGIVEVTLSALMLAGLSAMLLWMDWRLGLVMILPVPLLVGVIYLHGESMGKQFTRCWRRWSALTDVLSDSIPGVRVVKAFHQEQREIRRFGERNTAVTVEFNRIHSVWTSFWPGLILAIRVAILLVWVFALPRLLGTDGLPPLSAGTFVSFLLYTTMFGQPIEVIGQVSRMMNRATSSAHRIFEVLDAKPEILDAPDAVKLEPVRGRVTFENVRFGYDGVRAILKGISFDVRPGEMIGLVGPSGAGKTTVTNLIARFYEVTGGRILIDGVELGNLDTGHFRRQVGMVLQDPYLFHGSILENIRYGLPEAGLEQVVAAARAANAHDFICKLPHGYDTIVGERGHTLSGGERQRVSIARAVLTDPRILILDEATSSVDTETERRIQEALDRLVQGRTVFAIAHRLSTLTRATRLIVLEDGRISEQGTHAELLAKESGTYRKLHRLQQELHEQYAV